MVPDRTISLLSVFSIALVAAYFLAFYLPWRSGDRIRRNESTAIRTLAEIHKQQMAHYNQAGGSEGRFAFLQELLGAADSSAGAQREPDLPGVFDGEDWSRDGYRYRVFLPNAEGHGVAWSRRSEVSGAKATEHYACYAWPERFGTTGRRVFLLLKDGTLLATENAKRRYEGSHRAPRAGAGFRGLDPDRVVDAPAVGVTRSVQGTDGQFWAPPEPVR